MERGRIEHGKGKKRKKKKRMEEEKKVKRKENPSSQKTAGICQTNEKEV